MRCLEERGSITPLISIYVAISLLVALVIAGAGHLYLERKQLFALADAAALAGAQTYELNSVRSDGYTARVMLDAQQVRQRVGEYLQQHGEQDVRITQLVVSQDAVTLTLTGKWDAPWVNEIMPESVDITVRAVAVAELS